VNIDGNALKTDGCAYACGRNGKGGKLLSRVYIYFFVSVLAMTTTRFPFLPFSVSSVIYIIGGRSEKAQG
jgi:hypothetical protein